MVDPCSFPDRPHAGFCERLRYYLLERALDRGWDQARDGQCLNCASEIQARRFVAYARSNDRLAPI